jgi:uncharacterized protein YifN (PemK superfamily)
MKSCAEAKSNKMQIIYVLGDGSKTELGRELSTGIAEILFPDVNYKANEHVITISKCFEGHLYYRWKVDAVEHPTINETIVTLSPRDTLDEEYLSQTQKSKKNVISQLRKGTIVEIDYGFIPSVKKSCGATRSNKRYPDSRQLGEMHKRRLAIVVNASASRIQIVPISSQVPPSGDRSCFELERESLEKLIHYNDLKKRSFAICSMIETVSPRRILPPVAKPIKRSGKQEPHRSTGYPHKLSKVDTKYLDTALSVTVGIGDYLEIKQKNSELYREKADLKIAFNDSQTLLNDAQESSKQYKMEADKADALYDELEVMLTGLHPELDKNGIQGMIQEIIDGWIEVKQAG